MNKLILSKWFFKNILPFFIRKYSLVWNFDKSELLTYLYFNSNLKIKDLTKDQYKTIDNYLYNKLIKEYSFTEEDLYKYINKEHAELNKKSL